MTALTTDDVLEKLGGRASAAKKLGLTEWATYKWDRRGIPALQWERIAALTGLSLAQIASAKAARPSPIKKRA